MEENAKSRRRWYRFGLRTLFLLVTLVSLACWMWKRHVEFHDLAEFHQQAITQLFSPGSNFGISRGEYFVLGYGEARLWDHHQELADKYSRAARYPWLPVAPDPPEPELPAPQNQATQHAP